MAMKITRINEASPRPKVVVDQRLYRTNDGRLVGEGHPDGAFLFCAPGREVDAAEFDCYTLDVAGKAKTEVVDRQPEPKSEGEGDEPAEPQDEEPGSEGEEPVEPEGEEKELKPKADKRRKAKTEDKSPI